MKTARILFLFCLSAIGFSCGDLLNKQVAELHQSSQAIGQEVSPILESLVQKKNSLNIQGRTLTTEEMAFIAEVTSLEETFAKWNQQMAEAEAMKPNEERFSLEKTLKDAILGFKKQVEILAPKPF